jgi:stress response protein YsnF
MESRSNDDEVNLDQTDFSNSKISTDTTTTNDYADESLNDTKEEEEEEEEEEVIPLMAEELDVIKTELVDEVIITKEPIKEINTEQISIMHEELVIEHTS